MLLEKAISLEQFFNLPESTQKEIVIQYGTRKHIKREAETIKSQLDFYNKEYKELQARCAHPAKVSKNRCEEDEYGRTIYERAYVENYCPDCDKRWDSLDA